MVDVWEMEVQRARTWLRSEQRAAAEQRRDVFLRVNAHMAFVDHQRALRCSQEEDNEDLAALDFLSDVNAEDMSALLQAEAVGTSAAATTTATVAAASTVAAVDSTLKPIEMPSHLIASLPNAMLRSNGAGTMRGTVTSSVTASTSTTRTVALTSIGMSLSSDENVKELMRALQLDVHVHSDMGAEHKTEESTPPHAANGYQDASISAVKDKARRAGFGASMQPNGAHTEEVGQNPKQPVDASSNHNAAKKKPVNPVDPEAVASEMLSWVSGERDPTVLQRKESLAKRNRKRTRHFGIGSAEEQRYVQQKVKYYTQDSDSDDVSSGDDNDYSPSEDLVDFEPEEPVDKDDMLSDDYLNSDDESLSNKRKRLKRLNKSSPAKRKTKKSASGSKSVKSDSTSDTGFSSTAGARRSDARSDQRVGKIGPQITTPTENGHIDGVSPPTIDLRSSDDDANASEDTRGSANGWKNGSAVPANGKNPTLLRLKVPKSFRSREAEATKGKSTATDKSQAPAATSSSGDASRATEEGYETSELASDGDESDKENTSANSSSSKSASAAPVNPPEAEHANEDGEVSDTGTVDFDFDQGDTTEDQPSSSSAERSESRTSKNDDGGDASDADTVVLDEEPESDDLKLDYSDDSDTGAGPDDTHGSEQPSSVPGVQQFFDYKPLKLKPKKTVETRKMIPVHPEADFIKAKKSSEGAKSDVATYSGVATSVGSNGLRPKKIETPVTMKGKHPVVRRSIKVLDRGETPSRASNSAATRQAHAGATQKDNGSLTLKQRYAQSDRPTGSNGLRKTTKSNHRLEATGSQDAADGDSSARYLSYSGSSESGSSGATKSAPTKPTPVTAPSRYGGGGGDCSSGISGGTLYSAPNGTREHQFRRDPQMSLYDALHIDGKEEGSAFMDRDNGYKRPSAFKKLQAESARTGVPIVTSKAKEPDWDRIPIPKKGIAFTSGVPEPCPKATESALRSSKKTEKATSPKKASRYGEGNNHSIIDKSNKYRGKSQRGGNTQRASHYGPSNDGTKGRDDWRRSRTPSPPRHSYKRYEEKESRGGRGDKKRRVSSRSPSPRSRERDRRNHDRDRDRDWASREKKSSKQRARSPSPGRKRSRSADRDAYRYEKDSRKRSVSPSCNDKKRSSSSSGSYRDADARDNDVSKKHKTAESSRINAGDPRRKRNTSPQSGALASFDDGNDLYISESDPEIDMEMEKREDIRFDLESVAVDPALMARRVYVTGFNPAICGEELGEIFAPFGVETDRETNFPAIDVFTCQRTLKARGDACVTFLTEEGAAAAVEELNAKHVKSSLIGVRPMDVHTQRILNAQFEVVRDTWKCPATRCRTDVSTWDTACLRCHRKRCFGPSHHKITRDSWLCSICFTANDKYDNDCKGCGESLPDTGRFSSYRI